MMYTMVCKQFRKEEERFWFCQERCFVMPVSAKQMCDKDAQVSIEKHLRHFCDTYM